ncbi:hypothetical protein TNCV_2784861 [Trichonephila clavipes]|nr:hypothetical protein TNCV_2784861 [Trichonephila clavipes]
MRNYSPTNRAPISKKGPRRNFESRRKRGFHQRLTYSGPQKSVRTNENKINGERQRASASAQNGGEKMSETDMRSVPKDGEGREKQINKEHG